MGIFGFRVQGLGFRVRVFLIEPLWSHLMGIQVLKIGLSFQVPGNQVPPHIPDPTTAILNPIAQSLGPSDA